MKERLDDEVLIRKAMEELPMSKEMPQEFKSKITDLALKSSPQTRTARRPLLVAGMTAAIAALAFGAYMIVPKPAMAKTWTMVRQAVDKITSFRMIVKVLDSPHQGLVNIAASDGKFFVDSGEGEQVYIDGAAIQVYEKKTNTVTRIKFDGLNMNLGETMTGVAGDMSDHLSLKKEIADFEKKYGKENIQISPLRSQDGRQVYDVTMNDPEEGGGVFITVDAQTDLPIFIRTNGSKDKDGDVEINLRYNDRIDIHPNFPAGVKYQDIDLGNLKSLGVDGDKIAKDIENSLRGIGRK